jgi:hypothetical protein
VGDSDIRLSVKKQAPKCLQKHTHVRRCFCNIFVTSTTVNISKMKEKSRTIPFSKTLLETPYSIGEILRLKSVSYDFDLVDLFTHQYLYLRESNIDLKY